jgi:serine/threonine-protein kinase
LAHDAFSTHIGDMSKPPLPPHGDPPVGESSASTRLFAAGAASWTRADRILEVALDLDGEARAAYLDHACAGDVALRARLGRLLEAAAGDDFLDPGGALAGGFGEGLAAELASADADHEPAFEDLAGRRVDRYRVLREIGRGGMAVVYLAERADGEFEQCVALKVMSRGVDAERIVQRFRQERQILARTRHPGIAALLDGGVTADGRPYFVMEHVEGRPIDVYCEERRLPLAERLELFLQVARAVEHAHHNLVVHRDIKPTNILVTAGGQAKLLDFGIAKRLDPDVDRTPLTQTDERLLTPAFASPEQLRGDPITTATDVYQLGLLLYVLLTGRRPYGEDDRGPAELLRAVMEQMPARPSAAVGDAPTLHAHADTAILAAGRAGRIPALRLRRQLRGDLDNVVLMALRKEPERRYRDVRQLIDDVERHLAGRPVRARPDTFVYRAGKFVRRHALAVSVAAAATLLIVALGAWHGAQLARERDRARLAAARATQVSAFLCDLFRVAAPTRARGEQVTARELLDRGARRIDGDLGGQPELQASLLAVVGGVYRELGLYEEARPLLERALEQSRRFPGEQEQALTEALVALGRLRQDMGDLEWARVLFEEALRRREAAPVPDTLATAEALDALGTLLKDVGDLPRAQACLERALALREAGLGRDHPDVGRTLKTLARVRGALLGFAAAIEPLERAVRILAAAYGPDHAHVAEARAYLGDALRLTGAHERAQAEYEAALHAVEGAYGSQHPEVGRMLTKLGNLLNERGRPRAARPLLERALELRRAAFGTQHPAFATSLNSLGRSYLLEGDYARARPLFERAASIYAATLGPDHPDSVDPLLNLAELLHATGDARGARPLVERVVAVRERAYGREHELLARPRALLRASSAGQAATSPGARAAAPRTGRR